MVLFSNGEGWNFEGGEGDIQTKLGFGAQNDGGLQAIDEFDKLGVGVGVIGVEVAAFEEEQAGVKATVALPVENQVVQQVGLGGKTKEVEFVEFMVVLLASCKGESLSGF